jgi:hypothetical protein
VAPAVFGAVSDEIEIQFHLSRSLHERPSARQVKMKFDFRKGGAAAAGAQTSASCSFRFTAARLAAALVPLLFVTRSGPSPRAILRLALIAVGSRQGPGRNQHEVNVHVLVVSHPGWVPHEARSQTYDIVRVLDRLDAVHILRRNDDALDLESLMLLMGWARARLPSSFGWEGAR